MDKIKSILIYFFLISIMGCALFSDDSPKKLYKEFMNMEVPSNLKNFQGEGKIVFPVFMGRGYFIYEADDAYFKMLSENDNFIEKSSWNSKIVEATIDEFELDSIHLSFWMKDTKLEKHISLDNKKTYTGTYFPYIHYLLRDTITNKTYHLVCGMRE